MRDCVKPSPEVVYALRGPFPAVSRRQLCLAGCLSQLCALGATLIVVLANRCLVCRSCCVSSLQPCEFLGLEHLQAHWPNLPS